MKFKLNAINDEIEKPVPIKIITINFLLGLFLITGTSGFFTICINVWSSNSSILVSSYSF